jgi:hypothetical protein
MPACLNCTKDFPEAPRRGARPQTYCSRPCQITAANRRRSSTRSGRTSGAPRAAKSVLESPSTIHTPPEAPKAVDRLDELMEKAHSRVGVTSFEIAIIAKLRGISPWAPVSKILGRP